MTTRHTMIEVTYDELLLHINKYINKRFGSVSKFLLSKEADKLGFNESDSQRNKLMTYLSIPMEGKTKTVKSLPAIQKLYKALLNAKIESSVKVSRQTTIYIDTPLEY